MGKRKRRARQIAEVSLRRLRVRAGGQEVPLPTFHAMIGLDMTPDQNELHIWPIGLLKRQ